MTAAVCIRCGAEKKKAVGRCQNCGFQPHTDEEKAKSIMLSLEYETYGEYLGKTKEELKEIALQIQSGQSPKFDDDEVQKLIAYAHMVESISGKDLLIDGVKWLGPILIFIIAASILVFWFG